MLKQHLTNTSVRFITWLLVLTNLAAPFAIDVYTPSLPSIARWFSVLPGHVQLTITFYLLSLSVSQMVFGPICDRIGRRPTVLMLLPVFMIGSILCMYAHSMTMLYIGRIVQGIGAAHALVSPAVMSDSLEGKSLQKAGAFFTTAYAVIPIVSPFLGGYLQSIWGWHASFTFLFILSACLFFFFLFKFPETQDPAHRVKHSLKETLAAYFAVLTQRSYIIPVVTAGFVWSTFVVFAAMAPFIFQVRLHINASAYGSYALLMGLGFFVGNIINAKLSGKYALYPLVGAGLYVCFGLSFVLALFAAFQIITPWSVIVPLFLYMVASGLSLPNLYTLAVQSMKRNAGLAGALIGCVILLVSVIVSLLISWSHATSFAAMSFVFIMLALFSVGLYFMAPKGEEKRPDSA